MNYDAKEENGLWWAYPLDAIGCPGVNKKHRVPGKTKEEAIAKAKKVFELTEVKVA